MKIVPLLLFSVLLVTNALAQVQTNASKKAGKIVKAENYLSLSNENGYYVLPHFGMRHGSYSDGSGIQDLSLYYGLGLGFRRQNLSLESGLSFFHHDSSPTYAQGSDRILELNGTGATYVILPFTFRYDIPTGKRQSLRIGAFLNTNLGIFGFEEEVVRRTGQIQTQGGERLNYSLDLVSKNPVFFKTGIHSRIRVFNSGFLNLELGQFFTLNPNRQYEFTLANNSPVRLARSWEGISWSIGGILPLNVFEKKLSKKI